MNSEEYTLVGRATYLISINCHKIPTNAVLCLLRESLIWLMDLGLIQGHLLPLWAVCSCGGYEE